MRLATLTLAATAALGFAATAASAQPIRTRVYAYPPGLSAEEIRDYQRDQLERRQEIDREALRFSQRAERLAVDPDDDDD